MSLTLNMLKISHYNRQDSNFDYQYQFGKFKILYLFYLHIIMKVSNLLQKEKKKNNEKLNITICKKFKLNSHIM